MKTRTLILLIAIVILIIQCKDIIEDDISSETVELVAPSDAVHMKATTVTFYWEELNSDVYYNLQLVSPSFNELQSFILDTNLTVNQFKVTLNAGSYEWRVSAYNSSYATEYSYSTFFIDSVTNISGVGISIYSPVKEYTNDTSVLFKWAILKDVSKYRIEIRRNNWEENLYYATREVQNSDSFRIRLNSGIYHYTIRGYNESTQSAEEPHKLIVDNIPPNIPVLVQPADLSTTNDTLINFGWRRGVNTGTSITDSFYLFSDNNLTDIVYKDFLNDTVIMQYKIKIPGTYYWKVKSFDLVGNSNVSSVSRFTINNAE